MCSRHAFAYSRFDLWYYDGNHDCLAMTNKEIGLWFDKAYASLAAGDFATALAAFEYVISNFDAYAAAIAERSLRWYCVPLKTVFDRLQESQIPVNIHEVMAEIFDVDHHSLETGLQRTFKEIERGLSSLGTCIRVGEEYWISRDVFEELIQDAVSDIQNSPKLVTLADILGKRWFDSTRVRSDLPDDVTRGIFAHNLAEHGIRVLAQGQCFISHRAVSTATEAFRDLICYRQTPTRLRDFLADHFSTKVYLNELEVFFKGRLDAGFIELSPGFDFLVDLIKLDAISLDHYFQEYLQSLTTSELLVEVFFKNPEHLPKLSPKFIKLATKQLSHNRTLYHLANDQWVLSSQFEQLLNRILDYLQQQERPLSTKELLENVESTNPQSRESSAALIGLLEAKFRPSQVVIDTGNSRWLHRDALKRASDQVYKYLSALKQPQSTALLVQQVLELNQYSFSSSFLAIFEKLLSSDERFSSQTINRITYWQFIDPSYQCHQQFYQILTQRHAPLTLAQLLSLASEASQIDASEVDLSLDKRFKSFPRNRWGLSHWVWLNDLAFEYIAKTHQHYHINVIVGLVCQDNKIRQQDAIFIPTEDSRFVKDSINRWGIIYLLNSDEIDRIHTELIKRMGLGCSIDNILKCVTQLPPPLTDVEEALSKDSRFISIDDKWFARESAFYLLSESDLNQIYNFIVSLTPSQLPISLENLIQETLGRDARLTNAEEQLRSDERFQEIFEGFWVFTGFKAPEIDRAHSSLGNIHVRSDRVPSGINGDVKLPSELTLRKGTRQPEKSTQIAPANKAYITLTHLDILHGNLRIAGVLKQLISHDSDAIHFEDDQSYEFLCQLDETHSILQIRPWLQKRGLTFGDKISIQPGRNDKSLFIRPYGERDLRVLQEATQHQDVERLIDEARRIGKSYHDLMIEVMETLGVPLHREDIFQLVDYQRTATRNTIFEILSLVDCPYEELRYFMPTDRGYWSFDRKRKEAYDMKMQELIQQNSALKGDVAMLTDRLENQKDIIEQSRSKEVDHQLGSLNQRISQVEAERDAISQAYEKVNAQMNQQRIRGDQLSSQLERLQSQNCKLEEQAAKLETHNKELAQTVDQLTAFKERIFQVEAERDTIAQAYEQLNNELDQQRIRGFQLVSQLELLQSQNHETEEHVGQLEIQNRELTLTIDQRRSENSNLQETLKKSEQNEATSKIRTEELRAELSEYKNEKASLQEDIASLRKKIDEAQSRLSAVEEENLKRLNDLRERLKTNITVLKYTEDELEQARDQAAKNNLHLVEVKNESNGYRQRLDHISRALSTPIGRLFSRILRIS